MILNKNVFSLRDVSAGEAAFIRQLWGGSKPDSSAARFFLEVGGRPMLENNPQLIRYMGVALKTTVEELDVEPAQGARAFTTGALLYASIFSHLNRVNELPIKEAAIDRVGDLDAVDFILNSRAGICEDGQRFCDLLEEVLPLSRIPYPLEGASQIGAGALHLILRETETVANDLSAYETDPALADLRELFKDLES